MEEYFANLLREKSATTIVIVRDNATSRLHKNSEFAITSILKGASDGADNDAQDVDQAPIIPTRASCDDGCSIASASSLVEEGEGLQKSSSTGSLYSKLIAFKRSTVRSNRNKFGALDISPFSKKKTTKKKESASSSQCLQGDGHQGNQHKNIKSRWNAIRVSSVSKLLTNVDAPTLPRRRISVESIGLSASSENKKEGRNNNWQESKDRSVLPTSGIRQGNFLDNGTMILTEQLKRHIEEASSANDGSSLFSSHDKMVRPCQQIVFGSSISLSKSDDSSGSSYLVPSRKLISDASLSLGSDRT